MNLQDLDTYLTRRRNIIADHAWRDRDPAAHLQALQEVSEAITSWHQQHQGSLPAKLEHFLKSCSFDKAHALVQEHLANSPS